ncbi:MAG: fucose isomerase [Thermoprotei archaeon]|nr:MAG: fucose isomerase [Thermoprotei archaeon]
MRILVIPLASRLHGEEYYTSLMNVYRKCLEGYNGVTIYDNVVTSINELNINYKSFDLLLLIHLTGGTSKLAKRIIAESHKPAILVTHGRHNSLPSALSAKAWLVQRGYKVRILYSDEPNSLCRVFNPVYRGLLAGYNLSKLRVLEINENGALSDDAKKFIDATGALVKAIGYEEIIQIGQKASDNELRELYNHVSKYIDLSSIDRESLYKALRIYYAIRKIIVEGVFNAVSIDCFPLVMKYKITPCLAVAMLNNDGIPMACEDDFYSLVFLAVSPILTSEPGWIFNPSGLTYEGYVKFAHCTIAPRLGNNCMLVSHFESGYPYAVTCKMKHREYALLRLSLDYKKLYVFKARNIRSGLLEPGLCRTQLIADLGDYGGEKFIELAQGNHHVAVPWINGLDEMLKVLSWWMNWELTMYG